MDFPNSEPFPSNIMPNSLQYDSALPERLSLTAFAQRIAYMINGRDGLTNVWVIAEITDFSVRGNGHGYCTLIEKDAYGRSMASLRATIWQNDLRSIRHKFLQTTGQELATGMKVSLCLSANMHPLYGMSANVRDIDPTYTLGDMERIRREILAKLQKEGLYDLNKQTQLPIAPQKIAIISAPGAAGYGDFMRQLESSPFKFYTLLYEAVMQGEKTVPTVIEALERIEETIDFWDCVVVIRGGGATNDLNSFDNYELAERIARFPLPVIVGIGHERDNTVLDYISHTRCKTPTAVAAFLIDKISEARNKADEMVRFIVERTYQVIATEKEHLSNIDSILPLLAKRHIDNNHRKIDRFNSLLSQISTAATSRATKRINELGLKISNSSTQQIERNRSKLDYLFVYLVQASQQRLNIAKVNLDNTANMLRLLSPEATLKRGYSITRINGKAIRSIKEVVKGVTLTTTLPDGNIISTTQSVEEI